MKYPRINVALELTQARLNHDGEPSLPIIERIAQFLGVKVEHIRSDREHPQYRVRSSSLLADKKVEQYLIAHPMWGSKRMDFQDWLKVLAFLETKTQWTHKEEILTLKAGMNDKRTEFIWTHLQ